MRGEAEELRTRPEKSFASRQMNAPREQIRIPPVPGVHQALEFVVTRGSMVNSTDQDVQFLDVSMGPLKEDVAEGRSADENKRSGNSFWPQSKQASEVHLSGAGEEVTP